MSTSCGSNIHTNLSVLWILLVFLNFSSYLWFVLWINVLSCALSNFPSLHFLDLTRTYSLLSCRANNLTSDCPLADQLSHQQAVGTFNSRCSCISSINSADCTCNYRIHCIPSVDCSCIFSINFADCTCNYSIHCIPSVDCSCIFSINSADRGAISSFQSCLSRINSCS